MSRSTWPLMAAFAGLGLFWGGWAVSAADVESFLGVGHAGFGFFLSATVAAGAVANAVGASMAERWGSRRALATSEAAWGGMLVVLSVTHNRAVFVAGSAAMVAFSGAVDVTMNVAATAGLAGRPAALARFHALFNFGALAGALCTGLILHAHHSWRWWWAGAGVLAIAVSEMARRTELPAGEVGERQRLTESLRALKRERLLALAGAFAAASVVEGGIDTWGVLFLREHIATTVLVGASAYVAGQALAVAARVVVGPGAGWLGAVTGARAGAAVAGAGLLVEALATGPVMAAVGLAAAALGISLSWPFLLSEAARSRSRPALVVGGMTASGYLGFLAGPVVVGWVAGAAGLRAGLLVLVLAAAAAVALPSLRTKPLDQLGTSRPAHAVS